MNQAKNFASLVSTSRNSNIFLVSGGKDKFERDAWYYVRVEPFKISLFQRDIMHGKINLVEYGEILESGFGKTPPESVKQKMKDEYNFTTGN